MIRTHAPAFERWGTLAFGLEGSRVLRNRRLLIVHPGLFESEVMRRRLIQFVPRLEIVVMTDAETALVRLERETFDLIIAGVELVGFLPHGFTRELRAHRPEIPILATSKSDRHKREAIEAGALSYIMFPFLETLVAQVWDALAIDEELVWRQ